MKKTTTYENFSELADAMCDGEGVLHLYNCPGTDECLAWQQGVRDLAGWLDHIGAKIRISDRADSFYDYLREKTAKEKAWAAEREKKYAERRKPRAPYNPFYAQ